MGRSIVAISSSQNMLPLFKITLRGRNFIDENDGVISFNKVGNRIVMGTYIHGIFDNYTFRKILLELIRIKHNVKFDIDFFKNDEISSYQSFKEEQYDKLASIFRENMDMKLFYNILKSGI